MQKFILTFIFIVAGSYAYAQMPRWTSVKLPMDSLKPYSIIFVDSLHGYVGGYILSVNDNPKTYWFATSDGGKNWNQIMDTLIASDQGEEGVIFHYPNLLYPNLPNSYMYLGDSAGYGSTRRLIHSGDGGISWDLINTWYPINPPLNDYYLLWAYAGNVVLAPDPASAQPGRSRTNARLGTRDRGNREIP